MATIERKQGDDVTIREDFTKPDSSEGLDLTDAQSVKIFIDHPRTGDLVVNDDVQVVDGSGMRYDLTSAQTARRGQHRIEFVAQFEDGRTVSHPQSGFISADFAETTGRELPVEELADGDASVSTLFADAIAANTGDTVTVQDDVDFDGNDAKSVGDATVDSVTAGSATVEGTTTTQTLEAGSVNTEVLRSTNVGILVFGTDSQDVASGTETKIEFQSVKYGDESLFNESENTVVVPDDANFAKVVVSWRWDSGLDETNRIRLFVDEDNEFPGTIYWEDVADPPLRASSQASGWFEVSGGEVITINIRQRSGDVQTLQNNPTYMGVSFR